MTTTTTNTRTPTPTRKKPSTRKPRSRRPRKPKGTPTVPSASSATNQTPTYALPTHALRFTLPADAADHMADLFKFHARDLCDEFTTFGAGAVYKDVVALLVMVEGMRALEGGATDNRIAQ